MSQTCHLVRASLEPYVDGDLPGDSAEVIRAHLAVCADCAAEHALAVSLPARLKALAAPAPAATLLAEVMRSVSAERTSSLLPWSLLAAEAGLAGLILAYLSGLDGLARLAAGTAADVSQLFGWGVGAAGPPPPASTDLVLTLATIVLVAVCGVHLVVLGRPSGRRAV